MKQNLSIDWDGTCVQHVWPDEGDWLPGAKDALKKLADHFHLVIFSCRVAPMAFGDYDNFRPDGEQDREVAYIERMLSEAGIEAEVWLRPFKPPAVAYIDDRAIHYDGAPDAWDRIVAYITGGADE